MGIKEYSISKSTFSTFLVMSCTFFSRFLGFVRTAVITAIFGASGLADVLNLTFAIPNNLRKLMAEGALSSAFIPVLSRTLQEDNSTKNSNTLVKNILSFQLLILIPLSILSIIFAKPLIKIILAEFREPWQIELSTRLFRWFINYLLLISISAVLMAVLNSHNYFFIPAITPLLFSISVIASVLVFQEKLGVYAMVLGVLLGGILQILFQIPVFYKLGYSFKPNFQFNNPKFKQILIQWGPVLATSSLYTITETIAFRFASGLTDGSTSAMTNALVFWQLPFGIFSASITTVMFPRMSRQGAIKDYEGLRDTVQYGLRFLFILLIPSAVILSLYGKEIIGIAIQRGKFTSANTILTAKVLTAYSVGLFSVGAYNFLQRYFYSRSNFRIPFFIALFVSAVDIILSLILKETKLAVQGLAYANSIAFTLGLIPMIYFIKRDLLFLEGMKILKTCIKVIGCQILPVGFIVVYRYYTGSFWFQGSSISGFLYLILGLLGFTILTVVGYRIVNIEILSILFRRKRKKQEGIK